MIEQGNAHQWADETTKPASSYLGRLKASMEAKGKLAAPIHPIAYRILVKPRRVERKTQGGIALPDDVVDKNTIVVQVGQVIEVGDSAFTNSSAFPGPRAPFGVGDWVIFAPHTGLQVIVEEDGERVEYRLMNDDHVLARTDNPNVIKSTVL